MDLEEALEHAESIHCPETMTVLSQWSGSVDHTKIGPVIQSQGHVLFCTIWNRNSNEIYEE